MKSRIIMLMAVAILIVTVAAMGCAPKAEPAPAPTTAPAPTAAPTAAPTPAPAEEVFTWQFQDNMPAGNKYFEYKTEVFERIEKASNGRLIVKQYGSGEIVPYGEITEAVRDGLLDMTATGGGQMKGLLGEPASLMGTSGFCAGPSAIENMGWFYIGDGMEYANELWADYGHCFGFYAYSPEIWHSHKVIETADDLDGIKFRAYGPWTEILSTFGASVVTLSGDELYSAMERGIVDAFEYGTASLNWSMGYQEVSEYIGIPGIHSPIGGGGFMCVNFDKWNALPDDLKEILVTEVESAALMNYLDAVRTDADAMENFIDYGLEVYTLGDELQAEFAKRAREVAELYAAEDPIYKEIFENEAAFIAAFRKVSKGTPNYSVFG